MQYSEFESLPSPSYVFSADELTARFCHIRKFFGEKIRLVYAMKANPFLTADLAPYADAFEVCSPGEMHICEKAGIPGEKLVLSGVNKDAADFAHAATGLYIPWKPPPRWKCWKRRPPHADWFSASFSA